MSRADQPLERPVRGSHRVMSASGRVPARLVFGQESGSSGQRPRFSPVLAPVIRTVLKYHPQEDLAVLQRAFEVADHYHRGQKRKSGDPYITHPVAVTTILAEIGASGPVLVAGLLHDTVEDTDYTQEQLRADFGDEVAYLVDGVTKLDKVSYGEDAPIETIRKLVLSMSKDLRVLLIKLADRLHNARTWRFVSAASAAKKAEETLKIYAPLAHRLGLSTIKWELEDLSFAAMSPDIYREIVRMVGERTPTLEKYLDEAKDAIVERLGQVGLQVTVTGRPKHYYSIHQKMKTKGRSFDEINDILAVRLLVESLDDCYTALGHVLSLWTSQPGRFKDYIRSPKNNHYQSLHVTVNGPGGFPLEIQIRTYAMHEEAEYGVAAHWRYKAASRGEKLEDRRAASSQTSSFNVEILKSISEISSSNPEPQQFYTQLAETLETDEIVVVTPQGKPLSLPVGSTPVDFAYAIHTEVGDRTVGAKVDGRLVPLHTELETASTVEILTTKDENHQPSEDWLKFVRTSKARTKIRQHYAKGRRLEALNRGKERLVKAMRQHELPLTKMLTTELMLQVAQQLGKNDVASLYHALGEGEVETSLVISTLVDLYYGEDEADQQEPDAFDTSLVQNRPFAGDDNGVLVPGAEGVLTRIARCCTPVPPDEIVGIVTRLQGISVHRSDCPNVLSQQDDPRQTAVEWAPSSSTVFRVVIQVEGIDRKSLLVDTLRVISEAGCNIVDAKVHTSDDRFAVNRYTVELSDRFMLDHLLNQIQNVPGIYKAYRLTGSRPLPAQS